MEAEHLLPSHQSAYRAHYSTETAIAAVHDELVHNIDSGKVSVLVLLDLSAAFDTVDHKILLEVLDRRFGVKGTVLDLFDSYLVDRTQTFQHERQRSEPYRVYFSVPQGSVLGPEEFTAYTGDLDDLTSRHHLSSYLYADDMQLIDGVWIVEISVTIERLQQCVEEIHRRCASRRLQLNPSETEVIWFGNLRKIKSFDLSLHVGSEVIKPVNVVCDLGVSLNQELSMKQHINKVTRNCFFQIRRLKQVRRILGPEITTSLITAFVTSRLDYCNSVFADY